MSTPSKSTNSQSPDITPRCPDMIWTSHRIEKSSPAAATHPDYAWDHPHPVYPQADPLCWHQRCSSKDRTKPNVSPCKRLNDEARSSSSMV